MKQLKTYEVYGYYKVKDGVVYEICKGTTKDEDPCIISGADYNPYFRVMWGSGDETVVKYYLDSLIKDGDTFSKNREGWFEKTKHMKDGDVSVDLGQYFYDLCVEELENQIMNTYYFKSYEWLNTHKDSLNIPLFMFKGVATSVQCEGATPKTIDFTEAWVEEKKKEWVKKRVIEASDEAAGKYSFRLTDSTKENFDIEKKQ